jgi:signal transduction histidine kinase
LSIVSKVAVNSDDDDELRLQKIVLVITAIMISIAAIIWGLVYQWFDEVQVGLIPLSYAFLTILSLLVLRIVNIFWIFRLSQNLLILLLPFLLMIALGGFINGSAVILWALLAPIGALLSGQLRQAKFWFIAFISLVILSGFLQPYTRTANNLPAEAIIVFFIINISTVSFITFLVLNYFVKQKDKVIELMRKNRELELAYVQQEVMLRQSEKLATLGRLSAGMAHELNNPAAAALRGSKQLQVTILNLEQHLFSLGQMNLSDEQLGIFKAFKEQIHNRAKKPAGMNPLTRSDREQEIESWLENQNIEDAWDLASMLANLGFTIDNLSKVANNFSSEQFQAAISSLCSIYNSHNLLEEIGQGTGRITEIVKALKSYSYQDQSPIQSVDIHEGLNNTLVMLRSQLKTGITVQRKYDEKLPKIQAYGSELNQVWTNIIDNAIKAMNGHGNIIIKTFREDPWLVVKICDTGHGIPEENQAKVFDPFFTTKSPGEGTGLGLNISHNIIVQKHKGEINIQSSPGETCFEIKLPLNNDTLQ